jgi:pimeloyl-ACP methyl ester carboxylesterase
MTRELDLSLPGGRVLHAYDTGPSAGSRLTVAWHHGTPNVGAPPAPLFAASRRLGIRWIGYDRPGYGQSTRRIGRDVASAADDTAAVADALGIDQFAALGHSGGGPHALACAAAMPDRVVAVVAVASLAPHDADSLDWFGGMSPSGQAALQAARGGREHKERYESSSSEGDPGFIEADLEALRGDWSWFTSIARAGMAAGIGGLVDDDLAYVARWGFDVAKVTAPTLLIHGERDRLVPSSHARWLASRIPDAQLQLSPHDGHISVLRVAPDALEWLLRAAPEAESV